MTARTKTGLAIIQAAALLGVLGNVLLRHTPWGLNAFLFVTVFTALLVMLMIRRRPELLTRTNLSLAGAMTFFGSMFLIRDSIELRVADTFAILVVMGVMLLSSFDIKARSAGIFHYAAGFVWSGLTSAFGSFALIGADIDWKEMPGNSISRMLFAVLRGLAVALPLLLIFGALFMAADAVFEGMVTRIIDFDLDVVISHVMLTSALAWLSAGYLRGTLATPFSAATDAGTSRPVSDAAVADPSSADNADNDLDSFIAKVAAEPSEEFHGLPNNASVLEHINISDDGTSVTEQAPEAEPKPKKRNFQDLDSAKLPSVFTLGTVETVIILGLVDLLFVSFVAVQLNYFFGGMDLVQNTPDFKLAEYARRGFGELVTVSALVLPMLLVSHWLLRKDGGKAQRVFKMLAGFQIVLLFVIMASAVQRLVLLTGELGYGLTTVRFYPMVVMVWLAVVFVWFALTVFRDARSKFAWGALWSAIVILGATNLMNPDAFIAQTNLSLMHQGREFDAYYNSSELSADAVPTLVQALESIPQKERCEVMSDLHYRYRQLGDADHADIRSFNFSRRAAFRWLRSNDQYFHQTEDCPSNLQNDAEGY